MLRKIKEKTVVKQSLWAIAMIFILLCSLIVLISSKVIKKDIDEFLYKDVFYTASVVKSAVETSVNSKKTVERLIDEKLYLASLEIAEELRGKKIEDITQEELIELRNELGLQDISLFVRKKDDIVVAQSSILNEIGISTKGWGEWHKALDQLMSGKIVNINKGYYKENFWAGPIVISSWENKYKKFAYYFDGTTDFLIDPYILDEDIYKIMEGSDPQSIIREISSTSDIEEVAVINVGAMLKGDEHIVLEPNEDLPVLYGQNSFSLDDDSQYFQKTLNENIIFSLDFKKNQERYKKFYIPFSKDRVMVVVTDFNRQELFVKKLIFIIIFSFLVAFALIFTVLQFVMKKYWKPIEIINKHINKISTGDLTTRINIENNNELGNISNHLNKMTDQMNVLIMEIKDEIESLMRLSTLLSKTVKPFFNSMDQISSPMTHKSRDLFHEIDLQVDEIQKNYEQISQDFADNTRLDESEYMNLSILIMKSSNQINELNQIMKNNVDEITDMNLSSFDALQELNGIIIQLDELSRNLENKIQLFKVN